MANNVTFSAGTADGAVFATDDIAGVHYPYGKVGIGADDTFTILTGNTGTVGAGTLRVTLATDVALPAGTNAIGKLAANSGVDIGDVTLNGPLGGGAEAGAVLVTVANDSTGVLSVDDNGASLTVDNAGLTELAAAINASSQMDVNIAASNATVTVSGTVDLGATDNAVLDAIAASLALLDNSIASGNELQVDVVAALPAGDNNIGNVDLASAIPAGTNNIGDVDVLTIAAGTNLIGDVGIQPRASNGLTTMNASSSDGGTALTNSAQVIKATAGLLYGWAITNPNTADVFVQFYNTAAASVTVGTANPLFMLRIPALGMTNVLNPIGITFSNAGWSWAATSTAGGNGAPTTALDAVVFYA